MACALDPGSCVYVTYTWKLRSVLDVVIVKTHQILPATRECRQSVVPLAGWGAHSKSSKKPFRDNSRRVLPIIRGNDPHFMEAPCDGEVIASSFGSAAI